MLKILFKVKNDKMLNIAPTKIIVLSFFFVILIGAFLLNLPFASNDGNSIGFIDALFTATSATCVTGLVIADTLNQWTLFGQLVIIILIQIGGLGLITLATFFSVLLGRKVRLKGIILAQESINYFSLEGVVSLIRRVVLITFGLEFLGGLLMSISFIPKYGLRGLYVGFFTAISAFCNAGFDIIGDYKSFTEYNGDPIVIFTITSLIIIGGLGFVVWKDLYEYRKNKNLLLHTKVVLLMTISLILGGAAFFLVFEYNNPATMGGLGFFEKINSAYFHSVVTRTAGFNSLPTNDMRDISKLATVLLMFIGAAPGSTAGGIKVTTFGVILFAIISQIKGSDDTIIFKKRVPHYVVNKALAITGLSGILVIIGTIVLLAFEQGPMISMINVLYEVTSAFGTVGLSTGITPNLTNASKLFLILTMFLGRVGPVSFAIALTLRHRKETPDIVYPEGKIMVG